MLNNDEHNKTSATRRITGAGVLIITSKFNRPYLLLGREKYKSFIYKNKYMIPIYEEFGGGLQTKKLSIEDNALMELDEETSHTLNWDNPKILLKKGFFYIDIPFLENRLYRLYLVFVNKVEQILPYFYRNYNLIDSSTSTYYKKRNYIEMDELQLIPLDSIYRTLQNNHTQNIIHLLNGDSILKLNYQNRYISRRLYRFLVNKHFSPISKKNEYGYELCYQLFNRSFRQIGFNDQYYITLHSPYINNSNSTNYIHSGNNKKKTNFLDDTISYQVV
jgi:hypothetical protein